jgi:hypothetical protein
MSWVRPPKVAWAARGSRLPHRQAAAVSAGPSRRPAVARRRSLAWNGVVRVRLAWLAAAVLALRSAAAFGFEAGMPNPPAHPTRVTCGIMIADVTDVDDVTESFAAEVVLVASWHDPRLAFDAEAEATPVKIYQGDYQFAEVFRGWWPQFVFVNEVGRGDTKGIKISVSPDGAVRYLELRSAVFETPMDLHDFPFDTQHLRVALISFGNRSGEVVLEVDEEYADATDEFVRRERSVNVAGWDLEHLSMAVDEQYIAAGGQRNVHSRLVTTIQLQRRSWQLVWEMLFPLVVLVSVMWSIFWIDIDSLADRLNVSFIGVLTIVAYQFVVIENMPRMSYLTFTDTLLLISFVTMAATIPQSLTIHTLVRKGKQGLARTIDRTSRWAFPLVYFTLVGLTVLAYGLR